jgi:hypothetical protein
MCINYTHKLLVLGTCFELLKIIIVTVMLIHVLVLTYLWIASACCILYPGRNDVFNAGTLL